MEYIHSEKIAVVKMHKFDIELLISALELVDTDAALNLRSDLQGVLYKHMEDV